MIEYLASALHTDGEGVLLDVGCGPGTLSIPLSRYFRRVLAVDASAEMLNEGKRIAGRQNITNIEWLCKHGEELTPEIGRFSVVTFGNSLHWFDRKKMVGFVHRILDPHGHVVIIGVASIWQYAPETWQQKTLEVIKKYLGESRRTLDGSFPKGNSTYSHALQEIGFGNIQVTNFNFPIRNLCIDEILWEQYSTSYATPELFGSHIESFNEELRRELIRLSPEDTFLEQRRGSIVIAQKQ